MLSEYEGAFVGDDSGEAEMGVVCDEIVIRSVIIRFENVLRLPTNTILPSTKYA